MSSKSRRRALTAVSATFGAVAGVLGLIWYAHGQAQPAGGVVLDNGLRSPMPVIVIGPPLWVYFLAGMLGAVVAAGVALAALHASRRSAAATV